MEGPKNTSNVWQWLASYKPAASMRVHLLLAAVMWTTVGSMLLTIGVRWMPDGRPSYTALLVAAGVVTGLLKSRFVLVRTATRMVERIRTRGDGRCVGGFISLRSWALVGLMIAMGRVIRLGLLPRPAAAVLYIAVGVALLATSLRLWGEWWRQTAA